MELVVASSSTHIPASLAVSHMNHTEGVIPSLERRYDETGIQTIKEKIAA